jgi:type IV pilus assembly protein PilV
MPHYVSTRMKAFAKTVAGVGLVEVMVALVVLSIGLLGTATLYVSSMQAKATALSRLHAINLAADIADRIRANRKAGAAYQLSDAAASTTTTMPYNCVQTTSTAAVQCSAANMAAVDLALWNNSIAKLMPDTAKRSIAVTAATTSTSAIYLITLTWNEASTGSTTLSHTLKLEI